MPTGKLVPTKQRISTAMPRADVLPNSRRQHLVRTHGLLPTEQHSPAKVPIGRLHKRKRLHSMPHRVFLPSQLHGPSAMPISSNHHGPRRLVVSQLRVSQRNVRAGLRRHNRRVQCVPERPILPCCERDMRVLRYCRDARDLNYIYAFNSGQCVLRQQ